MYNMTIFIIYSIYTISKAMYLLFNYKLAICKRKYPHQIIYVIQFNPYLRKYYGQGNVPFAVKLFLRNYPNAHIKYNIAITNNIAINNIIVITNITISKYILLPENISLY